MAWDIIFHLWLMDIPFALFIIKHKVLGEIFAIHLDAGGELYYNINDDAG